MKKTKAKRSFVAQAAPRRAARERFCQAMDEWAALLSGKDNSFSEAWGTVRLAIAKSCLLDRMLYGGERKSDTPCPVHKGKWAGCHAGWPGQKWADGTPAEESPMLRGWYDAGCRCFMHMCGCTTGWQPASVEAPAAPLSRGREGKGK